MTTKQSKSIDDCLNDLERNSSTAYSTGKLSESNKALEIIMRAKGAFTDKLEVTGKVDLTEAMAVLRERRDKRRQSEEDDQ